VGFTTDAKVSGPSSSAGHSKQNACFPFGILQTILSVTPGIIRMTKLFPLLCLSPSPPHGGRMGKGRKRGDGNKIRLSCGNTSCICYNKLLGTRHEPWTGI
jgi:hypothetical protein